MIKTQKDIPTKHGFTLPKGLPVTFKTEMPSRCFIKGERDEPDGWDSKGTPSWLLALGLI